ncbi:venom metalloproteinase antarease-like TpachMP_B [Dermacentor variabilis]|uniref:venom metalloproteinase antarease-like TpachMP_B n=1 Tax=Dermacentor variabilis TaxID=34621 RepID=UPI003F5B6F10
MEAPIGRQGHRRLLKYGVRRLTRQHFQEKSNIRVKGRSASGSEPVKVTADAVAVISAEYADSFREENDHQLKELFQYLRVFFAVVNQIYARTDTDRLDLKLVVIGVVVLSNDTEIIAERCPDDKELLVARTPSALNHFIKVNKHIFSSVDVGIYLTNRKFARQTLLASSHETLKGIAYVGAACTSSCGALVYDDRSGDGWNGAAHEVLHLLGAEHDGLAAPEYLTGSPGAKDCPESAEYIMATVPSGAMPSLSACTQNQVLAFARSERGQCLLDSDSRAMLPLTETRLRKPLDDPEKYCRKKYMEAKAIEFVANYSEDFNIEKCILVCATTDSDDVKSYNIFPAPDYIFCGMAAEIPQACISGICREVPAATKHIHKLWKAPVN